jgi:hypothetical protein
MPAGRPRKQIEVVGSPCGIPSFAQAFVTNATAIPPAALGY